MLGLLLADGAGSLYIFQQNQPLKLGEHQIPAVHAIGVVNTCLFFVFLFFFLFFFVFFFVLFCFLLFFLFLNYFKLF